MTGERREKIQVEINRHHYVQEAAAIDKWGGLSGLWSNRLCRRTYYERLPLPRRRRGAPAPCLRHFRAAGHAGDSGGNRIRWRWVRNFWFRIIHFLMIAVVVAESLCGILCPLTQWEDRLRELAGEPNEPGSFIGRWTHELLFVDVTPSVLLTCYCLFGLAVFVTLILGPAALAGLAG